MDGAPSDALLVKEKKMLTLNQLIGSMIPDQEFAIIIVGDDGIEHPVYAGDGCDDEWDEIYSTMGNRTVFDTPHG